jgi:hypothetical protein
MWIARTTQSGWQSKDSETEQVIRYLARPTIVLNFYAQNSTDRPSREPDLEVKGFNVTRATLRVSADGSAEIQWELSCLPEAWRMKNRMSSTVDLVGASAMIEIGGQPRAFDVDDLRPTLLIADFDKAMWSATNFGHHFLGEWYAEKGSMNTGRK